MRLIRSLALFAAVLLALPAFGQSPYNGTLSSGTSPTFGAGKFGNDANFNSNSGYNLPISLNTAIPTSGATVELFFKTTASGSPQVVTVIGGTSDPHYWAGIDGSGNLIGGVPVSGSPSVSATGSYGDGAYHHVAFVNNGSAILIYADGTLKQTISGTALALSPDYGTIGYATFGNYPWGGHVAEERISSVARYSGSSYTVPTAAFANSDSSTIALYHLPADATDTASGGTPPPTTNTFDPSNAAFYYVPGTYNVQTGSAITVNPGNPIRVGFTGTSAVFNYDGSASVTGQYPRIRAIIDGQPGPVLTLTSSATGTATLGTGLVSKNHTLAVQFVAVDNAQARWTSPTAILKFTGLTLDAGATVYSTGHRPKLIWAFTDSIGECYNCITNTGNQVTAQNAPASYVAQLANSQNAEVAIIGFAGSGLVTSVGSPGNIPPLLSTYQSLYAGVARSFTTPPDLAIVALGQNDGSSVTSNLSSFASGFHALAPGAQIMALVPLSGTHRADVLATATTGNAAYFTAQDTTGWWPNAGTTGPESPDGIHPFDSTHISIIAQHLAAAVQGKLYPSAGTVSTTLFY